MPNHLDAIIEGNKNHKKVDHRDSDSDGEKQPANSDSDEEDLRSNFLSKMY